MKRLLTLGLKCLLLLVCVGFCDTALADYFYNPIQNGADPWCIQANGYYYFMQTDGGINIRRAQYLVNGVFGLPTMGYANVFVPPAPYNQQIWAPELHYINGNWYIYYTACPAGTDGGLTHRMFCARADTQDPLGSYTFMGEINTTGYVAIDGTVFQKDDGSLYFVWSGRNVDAIAPQHLYIAPMSNPWTLSGPGVDIAAPTYSWEGFVNEGPEFLVRNGKTFIIYSANATASDNYCLGELVNTDGNFLNPGSWKKSSSPVFATYTGSDGAVYAPGHCTFTKSLDGTEDWIIYHAAVSEGSGDNRNVRTQKFTWNADGTPNFGHPIPTGDAITVPSGEGPNNAPPVSVVVGSKGEAYAYAIGVDGALWTRWQTNQGGPWQPWTSLGGSDINLAHVHVVKEASGQQIAFAQPNPGGSVYTSWQSDWTNNVWTGTWYSLGGSVATFEPVLAPNGGAALYAIGMDGALWTSWQTNYGSVWFPWTSLGGGGLTGVHMLRQADGATAAYCLDTSGNVWTTWQTNYGGNWFGFANLGGGLIDFEPQLGPAGDSALYGVARDGGNVVTLWQTNKGGAWFGWASLGATWCDNVRVASMSSGATAVFASWGPGTSVSCTWQSVKGGSWNPWINLGGNISDVKPIVFPDDTMAIFGISYDALVTQEQTNAAGSDWSGWSSLGPSLKSQ